MMKLTYAILRNEDVLWIKVLRNKYKCGETSIPTVLYKPRDSNIWKRIMKAWDKVIQATNITQDNGNPLVKWNLTNDGEFIVKSAYFFIAGGTNDSNRSL